MNFAVFGLSFNVIYKCCLYIMCFAVSGLCNLQSQFFSDVFCRLWTFFQYRLQALDFHYYILQPLA